MLTTTLTVYCPLCNAQPMSPCVNKITGEVREPHFCREIVAEAMSKAIRTIGGVE